MVKDYTIMSNVKLSKNFSSDEFYCNCLNEHVFFIDDELIVRLQIFRNFVGESICPTSSYRCPEHNKNVGGVIYSYHTKGKAVDIPLPLSKEKRKKWIDIAKKIFPFVKFYDKKNFIHCDIVER